MIFCFLFYLKHFAFIFLYIYIKKDESKYMIYKIHIIILIAISVDLRHGEGPSDTADAKVSGKLGSTWKLFSSHGWAGAMDVKIHIAHRDF